MSMNNTPRQTKYSFLLYIKEFKIIFFQARRHFKVISSWYNFKSNPGKKGQDIV